MRKRWLTALLILCIASAAGCRSSGAVDQTSAPVTPSSPTTTAPTAEPPTTTEAPPAPAQAANANANTLSSGNHLFTLDHDGRLRQYIVYVPEQTTMPAPVVVALHGGGGTGADFQEQNALDVVADREGFVVMYPEGTGLLPNRLHTWNSGEHCCGYAFDRSVDDVGFLRAAIVDLGSRMTTDPDRISMTGHSNGAMMAYRFAAEASDVLAAIVPVGGAVDLAEPTPTEPVALLHIHSADDPRAIYEGGEGPPFPGTNRTVFHEPVLPGVQGWAEANGCALESELVDTIVGTGDNEGHRLERFAWSGCAEGAAVELMVLFGTGHGWPGVTAPRLVQRHLGPPTTLISASEVVWAFVSQFER